MEDKTSNYRTGFSKLLETLHSLVIVLERWKHAFDKGEYISDVHRSLLYAIGIDKEGNKNTCCILLGSKWLLLWELYDFKYTKISLYVYG